MSLTVKPSYNMVNDIFNKKVAHKCADRNDSDGTAKLREFYGDYELTLIKTDKLMKK